MRDVSTLSLFASQGSSFHKNYDLPLSSFSEPVVDCRRILLCGSLFPARLQEIFAIGDHEIIANS